MRQGGGGARLNVEKRGENRYGLGGQRHDLPRHRPHFRPPLGGTCALRCSLKARLDSAREPPIATSVVTLEEQMRGWLAEIGSRREVRDQVIDYQNLAKLVGFFNSWQLVPLDERAVDRFELLRKQRVRISTPDLKVASIALVNNALLLSAILRDFKKVPGLRVENWLE